MSCSRALNKVALAVAVLCAIKFNYWLRVDKPHEGNQQTEWVWGRLVFSWNDCLLWFVVIGMVFTLSTIGRVVGLGMSYFLLGWEQGMRSPHTKPIRCHPCAITFLFFSSFYFYLFFIFYIYIFFKLIF